MKGLTERRPLIARALMLMIVLLLLMLGWLSVRNAADRLYARSHPALATRFWPADGASLATQAMDRVIDAGGHVDDAALAFAREALRRNPRAAMPLVVAGFAASATANNERALALMEAARAREPRTDTARFWLLEEYLQVGNYPAALDEIQPVMALRGGLGAALLDVVGALTTIPAAHHALVAKLSQQPNWRGAFFQREAGNSVLPPHAIPSLLEIVPPAKDGDAARAEQRAVIGAMIARGDDAGAYSLWLSLLPQADRPAANRVYDPDFLGRPGSDPFNWSLDTAPDVSVTPAARSDLAGGHGLTIDFRATIAKPIASETIPVSAGGYGIAVTARRIGSPLGDGRIFMTVRCGATSLATIPLDPLTSHARRFETDVVVPASCPMATIELTGEPGDTLGAISAEVTAIDLHRRP